MEATLPSWVKCTDPIPREILEEVRSTVLVWMKNVKNYVEEAETYILNDEHTHQEIVDDGYPFFVLSYLCRDPLLFCPFPHTGVPSPPSYDIYYKFYAEGLDSHEREKLLRIYNPVNPTTNLPYSFVHNASKTKVVHTGWPRFIRRMILSDVNIEHYEGDAKWWETETYILNDTPFVEWAFFVERYLCRRASSHSYLFVITKYFQWL